MISFGPGFGSGALSVNRPDDVQRCNAQKARLVTCITLESKTHLAIRPMTLYTSPLSSSSS